MMTLPVARRLMKDIPLAAPCPNQHLIGRPLWAVEERGRKNICARDERLIESVSVGLVSGQTELWELSPALLEFHTFAFEEGARSRQPEIDRASADADRYYALAFNPRRSSYSIPLHELERRRGNFERASLLEREQADRFKGFGKEVM